MPEEIKQLNRRIQVLENLLFALVSSDRYTFQKHLQLFDGRNIQTGKTTGTKIGTDTDQKLSFHGQTPSIQQSKINDPSGQATDLDAEARTAINAIIDVLENKGLTAS